jgi:NADH-ubiquinone oxidoreductase chain 3
MSSKILFFFFIPFLAILLLAVNLIFAAHNAYAEKKLPFECGFSSFLYQNRTQFNVSFFIFALLFLLFDLEILLIYPYSVSSNDNKIYGLIVMLIFFVLLTLGFIFELGKNALSISSKQYNSFNTPRPHAFASSPLTSFAPAFILFMNNSNNNNNDNNNDPNINIDPSNNSDPNNTAECFHEKLSEVFIERLEDGKYPLCDMSGNIGIHEAGDSVYGEDIALLCNKCLAIICKECYCDYEVEEDASSHSSQDSNDSGDGSSVGGDDGYGDNDGYGYDGGSDSSISSRIFDNLDTFGLWSLDKYSLEYDIDVIIDLYNILMFYLLIILFSIGWILLSIIRNYTLNNYIIRNNYLNYKTLIVFICAITPVLILISIIFSLHSFYLINQITDSSILLAIENYQYWSYDYAEFIHNNVLNNDNSDSDDLDEDKIIPYIKPDTDNIINRPNPFYCLCTGVRDVHCLDCIYGLTDPKY